jgi:hypothetical protein
MHQITADILSLKKKDIFFRLAASACPPLFPQCLYHNRHFLEAKTTWHPIGA